MRNLFSPPIIFPEGGVEIGLFFVADRKVRGKYPSFPAERTIKCEEYTQNTYADATEPKEIDYYYCGFCHEKHLRECFDDTPVIIGTEPRRRCYVELAPRLGYARVLTDSPSLGKGHEGKIATYKEIEFKNRGRLPWVIDGWFIAYQGHVIGLEEFNMGRIKLPYDTSLRLTPRITV